MLAIRMQRTGRKGSASFRIIVQESSFSPSSGRVVARIGHYNPHTKEKSIDIDKVTYFLKNGAQPTPRVVRLLLAEKVKMPKWVAEPDNSKKTKIKNPEKLRKNQPKEPEETQVEESTTEPAVEEAPEKPAEDSKEDTPDKNEVSETSKVEAEEKSAEEKNEGDGKESETTES